MDRLKAKDRSALKPTLHKAYKHANKNIRQVSTTMSTPTQRAATGAQPKPSAPPAPLVESMT